MHFPQTYPTWAQFAYNGMHNRLYGHQFSLNYQEKYSAKLVIPNSYYYYL
ncbi:hypothetical protein HanXRQr2_Chr01g0042951 [Helianthus annuus]|uniref:Uncharacterized protein n=1 Tax=Helianthus annuus TaxID=4232 RepID=A0A9K3P633_HELAN|nr:hypothetical protein HanXRQr2_Chr01g0042951 [Helianthus annuus]